MGVCDSYDGWITCPRLVLSLFPSLPGIVTPLMLRDKSSLFLTFGRNISPYIFHGLVRLAMGATISYFGILTIELLHFQQLLVALDILLSLTEDRFSPPLGKLISFVL